MGGIYIQYCDKNQHQSKIYVYDIYVRFICKTKPSRFENYRMAYPYNSDCVLAAACTPFFAFLEIRIFSLINHYTYKPESQ